MNFGIIKRMWTDIWGPDGKRTRIPIEEIRKDPTVGTVLASTTLGDYKTVREIRAGFLAGRKEPPVAKPFFYLSKSKIFRRRVGRIIYGTEGQDMFL